MSGRLLKKFLEEQEQQRAGVEEKEEEEEEAESPESTSRRPAINPFDLLNDDEDEEHVEQEDEVDDVDESLALNVKKELSVTKSMASVVSTSSQKSKKKKKKKSKAGATSSTNKVEKTDSLDDALEELSLDVNSSRGNHEPIKAGDFLKRSAASILQVDPKCLNPENELRRIFGSKVVKSFGKSNQAGSSRSVRGARRLNQHTRKTVLVSPCERWPRWDGSLSMELLETRDGYHYFRYTHAPSYDQAQRLFETSKATHDLNGVATVLLYHPYHLDSLLTMADYFKLASEHQMAADAIAKSLYALECAWHPMFTPFQGNCQLKITHEENKPLFTTLFTHIKNLDRRGCHHSALEVCKLLLSLDFDDPMGAMFCIDYFALRAEQYAWLEQFSEEYKSDNSLWMFPNFSYSLAVCRFYIEQKEQSEDTLAQATKATSADLMKQALFLHPSALKKLVAKVPLKDQAWTNILKHNFFRSEQTGSPSLDHLVNIYVERSYIIWRLPGLQNLIRDAALQVIDTLEHSSSDARDWACVRKEAFSSQNNEYSHLLVSDFSDIMPTLPPENLQNFLVDPRMNGAVQNEDQIAIPPNGGPPPRNVTDRNALAVFLESMLPWVVYEDGGANEENQDNGQARED